MRISYTIMILLWKLTTFNILSKYIYHQLQSHFNDTKTETEVLILLFFADFLFTFVFFYPTLSKTFRASFKQNSEVYISCCFGCLFWKNDAQEQIYVLHFVGSYELWKYLTFQDKIKWV